MPGTVRCPECGTNLKYSTPAPPPRAKCPKCSTIFEPAAEADLSAGEEAAGIPLAPPPPTMAVPPAPGAATWYYARGGQRFGPFDEATMKQMVASGTLLRDDQVWNETLSDWMPAWQAPGLFAPVPPGLPGVRATVAFAGFWLRLVAFIIDNLVLLAAGGAVGVVIGVAFAASGGSEEQLGIVANIAGLLLTWLYFALCESSPWQATLGKKALGLTVTDLEGKRISFLRATGRHFGKLLSTVILFIGFIMAGFTEKKQALHDMLASCLVVRTR